MRAVLLVNPRSGRGRAVAAADAAEVALRGSGVECMRVLVDAPEEELALACRGASALVAVGGDGTVRSMLGRAVSLGVPLAVVPTGTENLAAREFGFMCSPHELANGLRAGRVRQVDVGTLNGAGFLVVASAGFDADLVHAVHRARRGPITRNAYVRAAVGLVWGWKAPGMRVLVDGEMFFEGSGQLVVANCREYALRLGPLRGADPADGHLDVMVLPVQGRAQVVKLAVKWLLAALGRRGTLCRRGRRVEAVFERPTQLQVDGDPLLAPPASAAVFTVDPGALAVLDMRPAGIA